MSFITIDVLTIVLPLILIFLYSVYFIMTRHFNYWKKRGIPHDPPIPFFGSLKDTVLLRIPIGFNLAKMYNKAHDVYGFFSFHRPALVIKNPELIKRILVKDFDYFNDRFILCNVKDDLLSCYNLFMMKNPEWKEMRSTLSPIFSSAKIKSMFHLMNEVGDDLIRHLQDISKKPSDDSKQLGVRYTLDVISSCVFGFKSNSMMDENSLFRKVGVRMIKFVPSRGIQMGSYFFFPEIAKLLRFKFIEPWCSQFLKKVFIESLRMREATGCKRNDMVDILAEIKRKDNTMQDDHLVAQAIIFFGAGFETSSSTISFTLWELAQNLEMQTKLRVHIRDVLARYNGELTYEALMEMKYLDMVVSETLRKYPPLPFLDRVCKQDYKVPDSDLVIEKGILVIIPLLGLHYDPNYFPNPEVYDPERFSEENKQKYLHRMYMPFGDGPHNCIGKRFGLMSSKVGLIKIISEFEVENTSNTPSRIQFDPKAFLTTSQGGLHLKFKQINSPPA